MTASPPKTAIATSSKVLCAVYGAIAIAVLIATWSQNVAYLGNPATFVQAFFDDSSANPASRSITVDIFLFMLAVTILMLAEVRKHGIKFVWLYILGSPLTAISFTFPLFLIARGLRIAKTDPTRLRALDVVLLGAFGVVVTTVVIWVDTA